MKCKNKAMLLAVSMLFSINTAMAAEITINNISLKQDTVTVSGAVDEEGTKDIILYTVADVENPTKADVAYAIQKKTTNEGLFEVSFTMNKTHSASDGKYIVYAICNEAENPAEKSFEHIGIGSRKIILDGFNKATDAEEIRTVIKNNQEICNILGISYLADVAQSYLDNRPAAGYTDENFVSEYNALVFVQLVNSAKDEGEIQKYFEDFASLIEKRNIENEDFIAKIIFNNKQYESLSKINEEYFKAVILCTINSSERNEIFKNISDNADFLGLTGNDIYDEYLNADEEKMASISKALVVSASKNPFESSDDIINAIETALKDLKKPTNNNSGSGGGGGGGGSSVPAISAPQVGQKLENAISEKTKFVDVSKDFWGREAIEILADKGIVHGDGGNFRPNDKISREEFVTIAVNAFKLYDDNAKCDFNDVSNEAWYYKYVASAYKNKIISGSDDGSFGIGNAITREDAATILSRLLDGEGVEPDFADSDRIADYARKGVGLMQEKNIIAGMQDGSFAPKNNCTRAEAAMMFYKILIAEGGINI